jgi:GTP-binding protein EngB required for normal cell division
MTTIQEVNKAIMFGDWTNTELTSMIDAVKWRRASLGKQTKASLRIGDEVSFTSNKTGRTMQGTVNKIAIKYVTVSVPGWGLWKVPANMLTKTAEFA